MYVETTLPVNAKYTFSGNSYVPDSVADCRPEKGAAAKAKPVPIKAMRADCLDPVFLPELPSFSDRKKEAISPTTPANN